MKTTPIKKLDRVLKHLAIEYEQWHNVDNILNNVRSIDNHSEAFFILEKLRKDGYAESKESTDLVGQRGIYGITYTGKFFIINFNGRVFHERGGYEKEEIDNKRKSNQRAAYTIAVGVGTAVAGIYALWEMTKSIIKYFCR